MMAFKAARLPALRTAIFIPPEYELANALPFPGREAGMEFTHLQYDRAPTRLARIFTAAERASVVLSEDRIPA